MDIIDRKRSKLLSPSKSDELTKSPMFPWGYLFARRSSE